MNKRLSTFIRGGVLVLLAFISIFGMRMAWADAGPGYDPTGGSCRGGNTGAAWFDTCFGVSWQYYEYSGSANIQVPGSGNAPGAVIPGSTCGNVGGFWHLGYERYIIGSTALADTSTGEQRGTYRLGGVSGIPGGSTRLYQWGTPTSSFGGATAISYGALDEVRQEFEAMKVQEEIEGQPGKYTNGQYWGTGSDLGWFCSFKPGTSPGEFQSRSNVRIGSGPEYGTSNWVDKATGNTVGTAASGETVSVTFSHDMKYTGALPDASIPIKKEWTYQLGVTGATVTMSPSTAPSPTGGTFTPQTKDLAVTVVPSHSYSVTMPTITSGTQTVTICERITYQDKKLSNGSWTGGESFSRACAMITVSAEPVGPVLSSCPLPNSNYTMDFGGTQAQSGVANMTKDGTWKITNGTSSDPAVVWAKPGDSVQFKHTLCFGAQNVRGNNTNNGKTTVARTEMPSAANSATIKAFTTPGSSGNYLFGKTLTGSSSQTFSLTKGQSRPAQVSGADEGGDYWFTYYSPSIKAGNSAAETYKCYPDGLGFPAFKTNGYQIPDFTSTTVPAVCNSAKKVPTNSDAGKVIEQDLEWNNVKSWLTTQSSGSVSGCGCGNSSASLPSVSSVSYGQTSFSSAVGSHKGGCERNGGCGWCNRTANYQTYDYWYYPMATSSSQGETQKAQVKIPFNYVTKPEVSTSQPIIYPGGEYGVDVTIDVKPRSNPDVSTSEYATITKNTVYEIVAFTVAPATSYTSIAHANDKAAGGGSVLACSYYRQGASSCLSVYRSGTTQLNKNGSLLGNSGEGGDRNVFSGELAVPDAEVGTKFCVAVGVWPSDSHNFTSGAAGSGDTAMKIDEGAYWNYSEPTCRTITKKPMVQFRSAGAYTTGGITASQTKKSVAYSFGQFGSGDSLKSGSVNSGLRRVFGSFTEYETIAMKGVNGFASGAGFGYGLNNSGNLAGGVALPGGYPNVPYTSEANVCTYSTQTFNNDKCGEKVIGASSINSFGDTILSRLISRYTNTSADPTQAGSTISFGSYATLENGAKYIKVNGNATISASYCMNAGDNKTSNTFVVDVSGTLTIAGDIKYGSGSGSSCSNQNYRTIAELPQMLIFANNINIQSNVTNIDAWLISGQKGSGDGNINTCSDLTGSQIGNGYTIGQGATTSIPCSASLRVNGPVFAKKMLLNRNAGAGSGNNSIDAAEIFNLRPDTYLWAYDQASRFSQAVTTYSRELAPRY